MQLAGVGQRGQPVVGHRSPEEIRQPAGQGVVVELAGRLDVVEEIGRAQGRAVGPAHGRLEAVAGLEPLRHPGHVLLAGLGIDRPAEGPRQELGEQAVGIDQRLLAVDGPDARDRIGAVLARAHFLADRLAFRRPDAGMVGLLELDQRQVAEQELMAARRPDVVQRAFDVEVVAGDARAGEAHGPVLAAGVGARRQRGGVEADDLVGVQPGDEVVDLLLRATGRRSSPAPCSDGRRRGRRR